MLLLSINSDTTAICDVNSSFSILRNITSDPRKRLADNTEYRIQSDKNRRNPVKRTVNGVADLSRFFLDGFQRGHKLRAVSFENKFDFLCHFVKMSLWILLLTDSFQLSQWFLLCWLFFTSPPLNNCCQSWVALFNLFFLCRFYSFWFVFLNTSLIPHRNASAFLPPPPDCSLFMSFLDS